MVFIWMLSYFDVDKNEGGEFIHQPTNTKIPFVNGRIIKMTSSGDLIWRNTYRGPNFTGDHGSSFLLDMNITSDGGFVSTGFITPYL